MISREFVSSDLASGSVVTVWSLFEILSPPPPPPSLSQKINRLKKEASALNSVPGGPHSTFPTPPASQVLEGREASLREAGNAMLPPHVGPQARCACPPPPTTAPRGGCRYRPHPSLLASFQAAEAQRGQATYSTIHRTLGKRLFSSAG